MKNTKNKAEQLIEQVDGFLDSEECRIHQDIDDAHSLLRHIKRELIEISKELEEMKHIQAITSEELADSQQRLRLCDPGY
tara:strand:+ start:116 stop:355 length:240 start_codon:yes stop_codon:yes gene_type:complete